jgi:hypothetical protein
LTEKCRRVYIHLRRLPSNNKLRLYHVENKPTFAKDLSTGFELEIVAIKDLEGHACWNLDLTAAESVLSLSLSRWGSAVIEVGIEEDSIHISDF